MSLTALFVLISVLLLLMTVWCDIATRTIPDTVSLLLLVLGGTRQLLNGPTDLALSICAALLLFTLLLVLFSRDIMGGGDVKLMAALAVGLSPFDCYRFVILTVIAGGVLATFYLLGSRWLRSSPKNTPGGLLGRVIAVEAWRIRKRRSLPYGVAIAAGGILVLLHPGGT